MFKTTHIYNVMYWEQTIIFCMTIEETKLTG